MSQSSCFKKQVPSYIIHNDLKWHMSGEKDITKIINFYLTSGGNLDVFFLSLDVNGKGRYSLISDFLK